MRPFVPFLRMRKTFILIALSLGLGACAQKYVQNPDPDHVHADFAVWVNGEKLDFSAPELMSDHPDDAAEPATGTGKHLDPYFHLHDGNGHVIHSHKPGLPLKEFFTSIQVGFSTFCYASFEPMADGQICGETPFRLFVNGKEMPFDDLKYSFKDMEKILITNAGTDADVQAELKEMTDDACMYSKTCPWKGEAPTENCIADPAIPCKE